MKHSRKGERSEERSETASEECCGAKDCRTAVLRFACSASMGKLSFQKQKKMTEYEKRLRAAEAAAVLNFVEKRAVPILCKLTPSARFGKIVDCADIVAEAAVVMQSMWRRCMCQRMLAALKLAARASKQEASAVAEQRKKEKRLGAELARLRLGERLSMAAVLRGDMAQLKEVFGPAVAMIARAMAALVRTRRAMKVVEARCAEVEAAKAAKVAKAAEDAAKAARLAAEKVAAGAVVKAAARKERAMVLEQLCGKEGSNACLPLRDQDAEKSGRVSLRAGRRVRRGSRRRASRRRARRRSRHAGQQAASSRRPRRSCRPLYVRSGAVRCAHAGTRCTRASPQRRSARRRRRS